MAPAPIDPSIVDVAEPRKDTLGLPKGARERLEKAGIDLSNGYPYRPSRPLYVDDVYRMRDYDRKHVDQGSRADPEKKALLSAAKEVIYLTKHIGTGIVGLQLKHLTDQQKDELGLLIAERSVVFFRDQDISPQQQKELGEWFGESEVHVLPQVPGITVSLPALQATEMPAGFRRPGGASQWHSDLVHERQPPGVTRLHNDTVPSIGGDTLWASGYAAYEKLFPGFRKIIDGRTAIYRSAHPYLDREHPIVRVHPATGWKTLWAESGLILGYLYDGFEKNVDIQVRFRWSPRASALWDNRVTMHNASWDYEGAEPRHGMRSTALAEKPFVDPKAKSCREALKLLGSELEELEFVVF
ncbi:hypothetical protein BDW62DRAFT_196653 [Aspergillus aurantiobrunneus]